MDDTLYMNEDSWLGSYYELSIELQPKGDDDNLLKALDHLWHHPSLDGPWLEKKQRKHNHQISGSDIQSDCIFYGVLDVNKNSRLGCVVHVIRVDDDFDCIDICLPIGMLERVYPINYPLYPHQNPWLVEIDQVFISLADWLYNVTPFHFAVIGEEAGAVMSSKHLNIEQLKAGGIFLSESLWIRFNPQIDFEILPSGLRYVKPAAMINITFGNDAGHSA